MIDGIRSLPAGAEIRGIPVVHDPQTQDVAHAAGIWPLKRIVVGSGWFALDAPMQAAVLMHEVYHCRALHMEIRWLLLPLCWTKWAQNIGRQQELDADAYAAKEGYGKELLHFVMLHPLAHAPFHPSPFERMNNLVKLGAAS